MPEIPMSEEEVAEVPLAHASPALSKYSGQTAPNYRSLWRMLVDGELTGVQRNGRWYVSVPLAARELGLVKAPKTAA
jgi:hypothetical protein